MLDNDMIRLTQKIEMIIEFKEEYEKLTGKKIDFDVDDIETFKKELKKDVGKNTGWGSKRNKQHDYSWDWIKRQPIWHTWELNVAIVISLIVGFLFGLVF